MITLLLTVFNCSCKETMFSSLLQKTVVALHNLRTDDVLVTPLSINSGISLTKIDPVIKSYKPNTTMLTNSTISVKTPKITKDSQASKNLNSLKASKNSSNLINKTLTIKKNQTNSSTNKNKTLTNKYNQTNSSTNKNKTLTIKNNQTNTTSNKYKNNITYSKNKTLAKSNLTISITTFEIKNITTLPVINDTKIVKTETLITNSGVTKVTINTNKTLTTASLNTSTTVKNSTVELCKEAGKLDLLLQEISDVMVELIDAFNDHISTLLQFQRTSTEKVDKERWQRYAINLVDYYISKANTLRNILDSLSGNSDIVKQENCVKVESTRKKPTFTITGFLEKIQEGASKLGLQNNYVEMKLKELNTPKKRFLKRD